MYAIRNHTVIFLMADYETPSFAVTVDVPVASRERFYLAGNKPVCDKGRNKVYVFSRERNV